jgi:hypothetical protein
MAFIANRLSWKWAAAMGLLMFVILYGAIPAWLTHKYGTPDGNQIRSALGIIVLRRAHWFEWVGIAAALVCGFISVRRYFIARQLSRDGEKNTSLLSRIIARLLD